MHKGLSATKSKPFESRKMWIGLTRTGLTPPRPDLLSTGWPRPKSLFHSKFSPQTGTFLSAFIASLRFHLRVPPSSHTLMLTGPGPLSLLPSWAAKLRLLRSDALLEPQRRDERREKTTRLVASADPG